MHNSLKSIDICILQTIPLFGGAWNTTKYSGSICLYNSFVPSKADLNVAGVAISLHLKCSLYAKSLKWEFLKNKNTKLSFWVVSGILNKIVDLCVMIRHTHFGLRVTMSQFVWYPNTFVDTIDCANNIISSKNYWR